MERRQCQSASANPEKLCRTLTHVTGFRRPFSACGRRHELRVLSGPAADSACCFPSARAVESLGKQAGRLFLILNDPLRYDRLPVCLYQRHRESLYSGIEASWNDTSTQLYTYL